MATYTDLKRFMKHIKGKNVDNIDMIISRLGDHVKKYPDDEISTSIKDWIFKNIKKQFMNPKLQNAFDMDESLPYAKNAEIYHNLPFLNYYSKFRYYFYHLLEAYPEYDGKTKTFYNGCKNFSKINYDRQIPEYAFNRVIQYCDNNKLLMCMAFDPLGRKIKNKSETVDELGPIGEKYIYNELSKTEGKAIFLENNGFGFDVLYYQKDKEFLIEVKTTDKNIKDETYFHITNNERRILEHSLTLPNTEYIVERVFINKNDGSITHITLKYDKDTDSFYNNDNPEYEIQYKTKGTDGLKFYSIIKKKNILKLKNNNQ